MTLPAGVMTSDEGMVIDDSQTDSAPPETTVKVPYPPAKIKITEENLKRFDTFVRRWTETLVAEFAPKQKEWAEQEKLYRARSQGTKSFPFDGACSDEIPVMAMAVDPVHARLDTGIFKADPTFTFKALKKSYLELMPSMITFFEYYQKHRLKLRKVCSPRLLEMAKHGSMILKTVYDRETYNTMTYDADWKVVQKEVIRFSGPRVFGVNIGNFMYPAGYEDLQACPIVLERLRPTFDQLKIMEASGKLVDVDSIKGMKTLDKTLLELEREAASNHADANKEDPLYYDVLEGWCDFDINNDGIPERMAFIYHYDTGTFLQLRYNWYFHQRKPYTLVPYTVSNESLGGIGIGEMTVMFQRATTQWHQMATDNAYLSNVRMFITTKDSDIEDKPRLFAGRVFRVNDPSKDLIPFRMGDTYNSTLQERQNLFGLAEKRTGISDYLTGRESPIVGSRATATSTLALIDEGTKRVEQVMENVRAGMSEVAENCLYIWMQYGLDDIEEIVFGGDNVAKDVRKFFDTLTKDNVNGAIAVGLTATDAKQNRSARQQVQMAIIQVMMTFYEKFVSLGTNAIQAQATMPAVSGLMGDVAASARKMFKDLLVDYDITDPESYLPELEKYLEAVAAVPGIAGNLAGPAGAAPGGPGVPGVPGQGGGVPQVGPNGPQAAGAPAPAVPFAG